jgi:DNA-directed DNA polymerase III PolC
MGNKFTHLHLHTEYSFLDGMSKVWDASSKSAGELIERLKDIGQESCAITDHGSTAGWVRFEKACSNNGIKPILGVEGYYCNDRKIKGLNDAQKLQAERGLSTVKDKNKAKREFEAVLGLSRRSHFCSWAMNKKGSYEILATMSEAALNGFYHRPRWDWSLIKVMKNCLFGSGCMGGILAYELIRVIDGKEPKSKLAEYKERAWDEAKKWKKLLGDRFYIEMMAIDMKSQPKINRLMAAIGKDLGIPLIITNDPHYVNPEDWEAHDVLLAINSTRYDKIKDALNDPNRLRYEAQDLYVKSYDEMYDSFTKHNPTIPDSMVKEALQNTQEIADRCKPSLIKGTMVMPHLDIPELKDFEDEKDAQKAHLITLCKEGWAKKIKGTVPKKLIPEYKDRLKEELGQITGQGFTPYFILCNKLMKWSDKHELERGPARGSSCGSIVAYLLDITMIDPIPHKLLFSRFIDPNRTDYPDVDMDFEDRRRREVVQYFIDEYGRNNVAILGNNMTFKAKMSLKDVARLYGVPLPETQEVCNLVIERSGADSRLSFCLSDTFEQFDFAKEYARKYPKVPLFSAKLEGTVKQQGVHAAGVVIADGDIRKYTSLRKDKKSDFPVTTIDKHDAEDVGLLKMDVLGLNTMTILNECKRYIRERHGKWIDLEDLVRDVTYNGGDKGVYKEFAQAHTVGIFQFGSPGLTRLSKQVKIDKFSEISDCTALHRPGPIHSGAMNKYPALKFGTAKREKAEHPIIEKWTKDTYGLIIYQEQVMQIVRELGDFDWGQTNTVRKVMSKSGGAEYFMKTFFPQWRKGCMEKGLTEKQAEEAFKRIMSFGCLSGDTLVLNPYPNQSAKKWVKIKDLYECDGYASPLAKGSKKQASVKMQSYSLTEGRLKPNRIAKVFCNGVKELFEITTESGKKIKATSEHRFVIKKGKSKPKFERVKNFKEFETTIAMDGGYSKESFNPDFADGLKDKTYGQEEIDAFKLSMSSKPCDVCKIKFKDKDMEIHHLTYDNPNSRLMWVCNSCHKALEQSKSGRTKKDTKGHKIIFEKIVSIKSVGEELVYDIEMEDKKRPTLVANGFVSHNSWAFNASHSVAYAFVSYFCMWFKYHYPIEYCTAYLNTVNGSGADATKKIKEMIKEVERLGISLSEPNVNVSKHNFVIDGDKIVSGLSNVKNVGSKAVDTIVECQPFDSLLDFFERIDNRACNKRSVENLIMAGAFDVFGYDKKTLLDNFEEIHKNVKKKSPKAKQEVKRLLEECKGEESFTDQEEAEVKASVSPVTVGKHLCEYYGDVEGAFASHINLMKLSDIEQDEGEQQKDRSQTKRLDVVIRGVLTAVDLKRLSQETKDVINEAEEQRYALANLEDETDFIVLSFKGDIYKRYEQELHKWKGKVLLIRGSVNVGWKKVFVDSVYEMDKLRKYMNGDKKPYNFGYNYLFQHPLNRYFDKYGGIKAIREKYKCRPLINVAKLPINKTMWALGVIVDIQTFTAKRGKMAGQDFYWVFFEDETFQGSFMVFPSDNRFKKMKEDLFALYKSKAPFLLRVQRDMKFKRDVMGFKQVSISIDKRIAWNEMIKTPFKFKGGRK